MKLEPHRHYGVREYWLVDPDRGTVHSWRLGADVEEALLPGSHEVLR